MQEGGMVPVDGEGNLPPEAVASDVVNGAPMGMVDVPNGGGPVDDGVPTELPEGTVVINAAAIRLHGTETIDNLINAAVDELLSEGVQISMEDPNPEDDVPVAISNGEYVIPPEVAEKIGYKKLEDMNERGRAYLQKQQAQEKQQAEAQQPSQPSQQPPEGFMGPPMPQEQAGPPQAPVQSEQQAMAMMGMMGGGRVPYASGIATVARPKAPEVQEAQVGGVANLVDKFMDTLQTGIERLTGGKYETTAESLPVGLTGTATGTTSGSLIPENRKKYADDFVENPAFSKETMPTYIPKFNTPQARAQGGFVGDYNYAQPQQATMGTPFPNAVDSNPQQSQSFLRPNDAKKNSRVELENGDTVEEPSFINRVKSSLKDVAQKYVDSSPVMVPTEEQLKTKFKEPEPSILSNVPTNQLNYQKEKFAKENAAISDLNTEGKIQARQSYLSDTIPNTSVTGEQAARIIAGEVNRDASDLERQMILDTFINRGNSSLPFHQQSVKDLEKLPSQYQTLRDHSVSEDSRGNATIVNSRGDLVATAEDLEQAKKFVKESDVITGKKAQSEATHFITRDLFEENQNNPKYQITDKNGKKRNLGTGSFGGNLSTHEQAFTPIPVSPDSRHLFFKENIVQKKATGGFINP